MTKAKGEAWQEGKGCGIFVVDVTQNVHQCMALARWECSSLSTPNPPTGVTTCGKIDRASLEGTVD